MNLKNKDITEGMYVTNGKDVWKVLDWNSKYTDCLLQKIDKNGNKMDLFVVAENYELYGDEKEPQIAWMNGDYCIEKRQIDAEQYFIDFYKDNKKFKESKKSLKERSEENEIIVSELQDTVEYFCGLFEESGELKGRALESLKNAVERLEVFNAIGSIYQWGVEVLNKCGIKYKGIKESKKSLKEYNKKDGRKYKIYGYSGKKETFVIYTYKRNDVFNYTMTKDYVLENFPNEECDSTDIDNLNYFVKYEGLGELIYGYMAKFNGEDYVDSIECVRNKGNILEVTINLKKEGSFLLKNGWWDEREATKFFGYYTCDGSFDSSWVIDNDGTPKIYLKLYIYSPNNRLLESLKESAKPIDEKNVAKFVDELNKFCDEKIHYVDMDAENFTKKYGKLYDFGYNWDYSYDDKGDLLVFDKEETLDWYDDEVVVPFIKQLAKKYGWYCEPAHSYADFMFVEL